MRETNRVRAFPIFAAAALLIFGLSCTARSSNKGNGTISSKMLPSPDLQSAFLQIVQKRHTSREYGDKVPDRQMLSSLLWAAYGTNRPDGKRTAPSAHDWQYIDVYVADRVGVYRFDAKQHDLELVKAGDFRSKTGEGTAPVSLVYVSDSRKFGTDTSDELKLLYGAATTGAIAQNVYLFCAANGLNTGVRADIDRPTLHGAIGLAPEQKILLAQSVGYPPALGILKSRIKSLFARF